MHRKELSDILKKKVKKAYKLLKAMPNEDAKISMFFEKISQCFDSEYKERSFLQDELCSKKPNDIAQLPGYPGSQSEALLVLSKEIDESRKVLFNFGKIVTPKVEEFQKFPTQKDIDDSLEVFESAIAPINELNLLGQVIRKSSSGIPKKFIKSYEKINDIISDISKKNFSLSKRHIKSLNENFAVLIEARKASAAQKTMLCQKSNQAYEQYCKIMSKFATFSQNRNNMFCELFDISMFAYMKIGAAMQNTSSNISNSANQINPSNDLKSYTKAREVVRYDLTIKPFEDLEAKAIFDSNMIYNNINTRFDPIGFVNVIHSFRSQNVNEMNCLRGKKLLLLERINVTLEWTFVMQPLTRVVGFVPSKCIKPLGVALGIVVSNKGANLKKGDFVAIINPGSIDVETVSGKIYRKLPSSVICVLFQDYSN